MAVQWSHTVRQEEQPLRLQSVLICIALYKYLVLSRCYGEDEAPPGLVELAAEI